MTLQPLLSDRPPAARFALAVVVPVVFGAVTGWTLGRSAGIYLVLSILGILGGVAAGFDHLGPRAGALRGALAGVLFGGSILLAHAALGDEPKADLPDPAILLVAITAGLGVPLAALGGRLRERAERARRVPVA